MKAVFLTNAGLRGPSLHGQEKSSVAFDQSWIGRCPHQIYDKHKKTCILDQFACHCPWPKLWSPGTGTGVGPRAVAAHRCSGIWVVQRTSVTTLNMITRDNKESPSSFSPSLCSSCLVFQQGKNSTNSSSILQERLTCLLLHETWLVERLLKGCPL